jgi:death on curing protein
VTEYLDLDDLLAAAQAAVGGPADVRDIGLLQSAVARPQATAFGEEAYPDLDSKAAALLHAIVGGHPLVDGNRRLGWVATRLSYRMNGADLRADPDDAYDLVIAVARGELRDVPEIAGRLARSRAVSADDGSLQEANPLARQSRAGYRRGDADGEGPDDPL